MAQRGMAWRGLDGLGAAWLGKARIGMAWRDKTRVISRAAPVAALRRTIWKKIFLVG